jgi:hypothetical protein
MSAASRPEQNGVPAYEPPPLPPGIRRALRVFVAHFPNLLRKHHRKWVACDGNGVLYVGDSQESVYRRCLKRGLKDDEFVVDFVLPGTLDALNTAALQEPT